MTKYNTGFPLKLISNTLIICSSKKCENSATCNTCAEAHVTSKCTNVTKECANCDYSNKKFHTKYNVNHSAIDSEFCEILKSKIKKYIEMTDYPSLPDSATSQIARNTGTTTSIRNASSTSQISSNTETTIRGDNNTN